VVEVREDRSRAKPGIRQALQRGQERVQSHLVRVGGDVVVPGVGLLLQNLAGVGGGGRPGSSLRRLNHPRSSLRDSRSEIVMPLARTARHTRGSGVVSVCSSARKRWTQRSQFVGSPETPRRRRRT
jgi:hypothetical protein